MRIIYLTLDDVNKFMMRRWARQSRCRLACPAASRLHTLSESADAVVLDFDFLPATIRDAWLSRLLRGALAGRVLIHGHNISAAQIAALRPSRVGVCRGLLRKRVVCCWLDRVRRARVLERRRREHASDLRCG
jgi:hypothetical protein